jgi:hypothetical protein
VKNSGLQSAWSFALQRLIENPGLNFREIAEGRLDHHTVGALQGACNRLLRAGVLRAEIPKGRCTGKPLLKYFVENLEKVPPSWKEIGVDYTAERGKKHAPSKKSVNGRVATGYAKIAKIPEELREKQAVLTPKTVAKPNGHWESVPTMALPTPEVDYKDVSEAGPKIVLNFPSGPKKLSIKTAKLLYLQLKEVFD